MKITDLRVASTTGNSITITWTKPAGAVDHIVYWDNDPQIGMSKRDPNPPCTTLTDNKQTWYFEVRAMNMAGALTQPSNRVIWPTPSPTPTPTPTPIPSPTPITARSVSVKTKHMPGTTVPISAAPTVNGQTFKAWTGDTSTLANPSSASTTLTVPTTLDVSVEATY
jgi:hypothetical protein